eukprot:3117082-Amphidinium_carterae.1
MERLFDACLLRELRAHPHEYQMHQLARAHMQPQEGIGLLHAIVHSSHALRQPLVIVKLDVKTAFDSSILVPSVRNQYHYSGESEGTPTGQASFTGALHEGLGL